MTGAILGLVVLFAVCAVAYQRYAKSKEYKGYKATREAREGHTPALAWDIHHPDEMDKYVRRQRCHCGNKIWKRAEATPPDAPHVRVAVCECYHCEEVIRLYFAIEYLN